MPPVPVNADAIFPAAFARSSQVTAKLAPLFTRRR